MPMNRYFGTHTLGGEWHALIPRYLLLGDRVRGKRILDIGCGTGIGSSLLLEMGAESVRGVDHRPEVVDLARIKHDKIGLDFHVMFWESLEFEDDSFDIVVCLDPSSPVTDHNLLLEVRRVLKDNGEYICALERTKIVGMESLLPRYGYDSPSNQITLNQASERVPQIGEFSAHFETVFNLVQRPHLSYLFEPQSPKSASDAALKTHRHLPEGYRAGVLRTEGDTPPADDTGGQWLPTDDQLLLDQNSVGGVELFFCGAADLAPPPAAEIRLPYYNIMERLSQVIENLQSRQSLGGETSVFDEVLDHPDLGPDVRTTQEYISTPKGYEHPLDDAPTGVRPRPTMPDPVRNFPSAAALFQNDALESYRDKISEHYRQIRHELDTLQHHTRAALIERDDYINHLVNTIHARESGGEWGAPPQPATPGSTWREETTQVFKIASIGKNPEGNTLDELAELEVPDRAKELEKQIASLRDERQRLDDLLAAHEQRLVKIAPAPSDAHANTSEPEEPAGTTTISEAGPDEIGSEASDANGLDAPAAQQADDESPETESDAPDAEKKTGDNK
ncbi:methyltransferase domain-containing protein [Bradymonas sediminis]|uniref:Uncharacterized protein n=1 Tax=Bradymonas sediminis TaxID=1548548 RepID=A0A2Z4FKD9_9DELT|nr:methyltransferase domain-containing protein [Bradymonas sediminis]AWV89419.1 hypothetical protein DN745_08740 [Bradymonas sediminis]TDP73601.1 methyltransferase family protein [Bradymonas sediminis]